MEAAPRAIGRARPDHLRIKMKATQIVASVPKLAGARQIYGKGLDRTVELLSGMVALHPSGIKVIRDVLGSDEQKYFKAALEQFFQSGDGREPDNVTVNSIDAFFGSHMMQEASMWQRLSVKDFEGELNGVRVSVPVVYGNKALPRSAGFFPLLAGGRFWAVDYFGPVPSVRRIIKMPIDIGLHLLPCQVLTRKSGDFISDMTVTRLEGHVKADIKAVLSLQSLGINFGDSILLEAHGPDAKEMMEKMISFFRRYNLPDDRNGVNVPLKTRGKQIR